MEFPLIPAGYLNVPVRESVERYSPKAVESPSPSWTSANTAILLRAYKPAWDTFFIDSENLQHYELVDHPKTSISWKSHPSQTVKTSYQKTAYGQETKLHAVDLYI